MSQNYCDLTSKDYSLEAEDTAVLCSAILLLVTVAHGGSVNGVRFSPDSLHLVSFGTDDRLRLWDTATGKNTLVGCLQN